MAACPEERKRRRRYTRQPSEAPLVLTDQMLALVRYVGELRLATTSHLAALSDLPLKTTRRRMRELFDHGLVEVVPVPRAAVCEPTTDNDAALLFGSAPNVYTLTRAGLKALQATCDAGRVHLPAERYGPRNALFLAHELALRDIRVWFELSARRHAGQQLQVWHDGAAAEIDLKQTRPPRLLRPDAWLVYRVLAGPKQAVLVCFVELDRGTERGAAGRWKEKLVAYEAALMSQTGRLREITGYVNARVIVVAPTGRRRDHLAELVAKSAPPALAARFWFADRSILAQADLHAPGWRQPGSQLLRPLIPVEVTERRTMPSAGTCDEGRPE